MCRSEEVIFLTLSIDENCYCLCEDIMHFRQWCKSIPRSGGGGGGYDRNHVPMFLAGNRVVFLWYSCGTA